MRGSWERGCSSGSHGGQLGQLLSREILCIDEALKYRAVGYLYVCPIYVDGEQCSGLYGVTRSDKFYGRVFLVFFLYSGMSATKQMKLIGSSRAGMAQFAG